MAAAPRKVNVAEVRLWGERVGAVSWDETGRVATFEYAPSFIQHGLNISPLVLPLERRLFLFPALNPVSFYGLPGLLADSLPDRYGNALIDLWLEQRGRSKADFSPVERLCYIGTRGMGALEFRPALVSHAQTSVPMEIAELTQLAQQILDSKEGLRVSLSGYKKRALETIIRVGTSAGGARPKALIAWNPVTNEVRSGQVAPPGGFESWILKFDGIQDQVLGDSRGFGHIEYAYSRMAIKAGLTMAECRLFTEGGRAHFMTRRFDRTPGGEKVHMQSLCALAHFDFNAAGAYGYEQAFATMQRLNIGHDALEQMFRRMAFNVVARNQDDHTKNVSFLMHRDGQWSLSPAYDVMWAYNPSGPWTNLHQMSVNGKRDGIGPSDLITVGRRYGLRNAGSILDDVRDVVNDWPTYASKAGVPESRAEGVRATHRLWR